MHRLLLLTKIFSLLLLSLINIDLLSLSSASQSESEALSETNSPVTSLHTITTHLRNSGLSSV